MHSAFKMLHESTVYNMKPVLTLQMVTQIFGRLAADLPHKICSYAARDRVDEFGLLVLDQISEFGSIGHVDATVRSVRCGGKSKPSATSYSCAEASIHQQGSSAHLSQVSPVYLAAVGQHDNKSVSMWWPLCIDRERSG